MNEKSAWLYRGWRPRAVIVAGGPLPDPAWLISEISMESAFIAAADAGVAYLPLLGLDAALWVGDGDSAPAGPPPGAIVKFYPSEKDYTDLELVLAEIHTRNLSPIALIAGLGGRSDQELANFHIAAGYRLEHGPIALYGDDCRVRFAIPGEPEVIVAEPGYDQISQIPLAGDAEGVTTEGLQWDLKGETLRWASGRGVSNKLRSPWASVTLEKGILAIVEQRTLRPSERSPSMS